MKTLIAVLLFVSSTAFAETFKCDAQFIIQDENNKFVTYEGVVLLKEVDGKQVMDITMEGQAIVENEPVSRGVLDRPQLDMIQQIDDFKKESPGYAKLAEQLYGDKIDNTLRGATRTTFYGFERDEIGAALGFHYNRAGQVLSTEISLAWLGTGLCK